MKLATLFSGVGAPEQGAKRVYGDALELVFACEWDKYARESFNANYKIAPEHFHKDINELDGTQYQGQVDCIVGGSPCQDFSLAGLRTGIDGHRGQLIWQYYRIIKEVKPKYFIYENVKGILSDKEGKTLSDFLEVFRTLGYLCHFEVLNSKDYGVPQNRERLFIVGFLDEDEYFRFRFADKIPLTRTISDVLEDDVGDKFYLSEKALSGFTKHKERHQEKGNVFAFKPKHIDDIASCLTTKYGGRATDTFVYVDKKVIRKLTPRECFRLQDFPDSFKFVVSDTQLYKQAGNSMTVAVLEMIFIQLSCSDARGDLFDFLN
jgi:DNA (cytosine-5)-methyltransferase 1